MCVGRCQELGCGYARRLGLRLTLVVARGRDEVDSMLVTHLLASWRTRRDQKVFRSKNRNALKSLQIERPKEDSKAEGSNSRGMIRTLLGSSVRLIVRKGAAAEKALNLEMEGEGGMGTVKVIGLIEWGKVDGPCEHTVPCKVHTAGKGLRRGKELALRVVVGEFRVGAGQEERYVPCFYGRGRYA